MDEAIRTAAISPLRQRLIDDMNMRVQRQSRWMPATIRMDGAGFGRRLGVARP